MQTDLFDGLTDDPRVRQAEWAALLTELNGNKPMLSLDREEA